MVVHARILPQIKLLQIELVTNILFCIKQGSYVPDLMKIGQ